MKCDHRCIMQVLAYVSLRRVVLMVMVVVFVIMLLAVDLPDPSEPYPILPMPPTNEKSFRQRGCIRCGSRYEAWVRDWRMAGLSRYLMHASTDKPMYKPGEIMFSRAVVLSHDLRHSLEQCESAQFTALVKDAMGNEVVSSQPQPCADGVVVLSWPLPNDLPGGKYTITYGSPQRNIIGVSIPFWVQSYRNPTSLLSITFDEPGYGAGDVVHFTVNVRHLDGPPLERSILHLNVRNMASDRGADAAGLLHQVSHDLGTAVEATVKESFTLPTAASLDVMVTATVQGSGLAATKVVPMVQDIRVRLVPESGVALPARRNRIYVEALDDAGQPVAMQGSFVVPEATDESGHTWARIQVPVRTEPGSGHGVFEVNLGPEADAAFTPPVVSRFHVQRMQEARLHVTKPRGRSADVTFALPPLPAHERELFSLHVAQSVARATGGQPAFFLVIVDNVTAPLEAPDAETSQEGTVNGSGRETANDEHPMRLCLHLRNDEVASVDDVVLGGSQPVKIIVPSFARGALRLSLESGGYVVAERLVFVVPPVVDVAIETTTLTPLAGAEMELTIEAQDKVLREGRTWTYGVAVYDMAGLSRLRPDQLPPSFLTSVWLEKEVLALPIPTLYDAAFAPEGAKEALEDHHLDALLALQEWRRFEARRSRDMLRDHPERAKQVLAWQPDPRMIRVAAAGGGLERGMMKARFVAEMEAVPMVAYAVGAAHHDAVDEDGAEADVSDEDAPASLERRPGRQWSDALRVGRDMRSYFHKRENRAKPDLYEEGQRYDWTESLVWAASLPTSGPDPVKVKFTLPHSVSTFVAIVTAFQGPPGVQASPPTGFKPWMGQASLQFSTVRMHTMDLSIPPTVATGDSFTVIVTVVNKSPRALSGHVMLQSTSDRFILPDRAPAHVEAMSKLRMHLSVQVNPQVYDYTGLTVAQVRQAVEAETVPMVVKFVGSDVHESTSRDITIVPCGILEEVYNNGALKVSSSGTATLSLSVGTGTYLVDVSLVPNQGSQIMQALESLIRQPHGCFEQTSATTYPLVMAQRWWATQPATDKGAKAAQAKADTILKSGLQRLLSFETKTGGFEWFGQAPGHNSLSAYGLMQFADMSTVATLPKTLLQRASKWVLGLYDATKKSFAASEKAIDSFGRAPKDVTDAYILWSLTEVALRSGLSSASTSGVDVVTLLPMLHQLVTQSVESKNAYLIALVACSLGNVLHSAPLREAYDLDFARNDADKLEQVVKVLLQQKLPSFASADGSICSVSVKGDEDYTSITNSRGPSFCVETSSLALLAWHRGAPDDPLPPAGTAALEWLVSQAKAGAWSSTQGTILALKALLAQGQANQAPSAGVLTLKPVHGVGEQRVELSKGFARRSRPLPLPSVVVAGDVASLQIDMVHAAPVASVVPVTVRAQRRVVPSSSESLSDTTACAHALSLHTRWMSSTKLPQGSPMVLAVSVEAKGQTPAATNATTGMVVARVGIPAAMEVNPESLDRAVAQGDLAAYEMAASGVEVVLYWRGVDPTPKQPSQRIVRVSVSGVARWPGSFSVPPAHVYPYYAPECGQWVVPSSDDAIVTIAEGD